MDGTLHVPMIRILAKILVDSGHDIWVLTARWDDTAFDENGKRIGHLGQNYDLRTICRKIGIPEEKILFTNGALKEKIYFEQGFDMHFDDQLQEVEEINKKGGNAVLVDGRVSDLKDQIQMIEWFTNKE